MDWRAGDLALCVRKGPPCEDCGYVSDYDLGKVYSVTGYRLVYFTAGAAPMLFLGGLDDEVLTSHCWHIGNLPKNFIKVTPPDTEDTFDREVIAALTGEPVHVPQHDALHNGCQCEVSHGQEWHRSLANREGIGG